MNIENNIRKFKLIDKEYKRVSQKRKERYRYISNKVLSILRVMGSIERKFSKDHKDLDLKVTKTWFTYINISNSKIKNGIWKAYAKLDIGDGDFIEMMVKIPVKYFSMDHGDIEEEHTKWCENIVKSELRNKKLNRIL